MQELEKERDSLQGEKVSMMQVREGGGGGGRPRRKGRRGGGAAEREVMLLTRGWEVK